MEFLKIKICDCCGCRVDDLVNFYTTDDYNERETCNICLDCNNEFFLGIEEFKKTFRKKIILQQAKIKKTIDILETTAKAKIFETFEDKTGGSK